MSEDEKETSMPLEKGEEILKETGKYRADLKGSIGMGSRTVKVVLTNKRLAILPSKWSAPVAIMKGSALSLLKSRSKEEIFVPLNTITEVKKNMFGGGINVVTAEKKYTLEFKIFNDPWVKAIKQAIEASK